MQENGKGVGHMRKSRLESCEEILSALMKEASAIDRLSYETGMDCNAVKQHIHFMMKNGLVVERKLGKKTIFAATERGVAVLRALNFQKYLEKVKNSIGTIDEAMQIIPAISKQDRTAEEEN
jgi:predicted transcriptional regulator